MLRTVTKKWRKYNLYCYVTVSKKLTHNIIQWRRLKNLNVFFCYVRRQPKQEYTFKTKYQPLEAVYTEMFSGKDILKICGKVTGEHKATLFKSQFSIVIFCKYATFFRTPFYKNTSEWLLPFHADANPLKQLY